MPRSLDYFFLPRPRSSSPRCRGCPPRLGPLVSPSSTLCRFRCPVHSLQHKITKVSQKYSSTLYNLILILCIIFTLNIEYRTSAVQPDVSWIILSLYLRLENFVQRRDFALRIHGNFNHKKVSQYLERRL